MKGSIRRLGYLCVATIALLGVRTADADVVTDWNLVAKTAIVNNAGKPPTTGSAILAYMHGAMYDAVQAIEGQYTPYAYIPAALDPSASKEAAVVSAGYHVLIAVFPEQSAFLDPARLNTLAAIPDGESKDRGLAIGDGCQGDRARAVEKCVLSREDRAQHVITRRHDGCIPGSRRIERSRGVSVRLVLPIDSLHGIINSAMHVSKNSGAGCRRFARVVDDGGLGYQIPVCDHVGADGRGL